MSRLTINDYFLKFLQDLNRTIVEDGELGAFEYYMSGTGMKGDYLVLKNYNTRMVYFIRTDSITSEHMDMLGISSPYEERVIRLPNATEEEYFQTSTVSPVLSMECEKELQLAMHNIATYARDQLGLYNDELWHKPYSDM